MKRGFLIDMDGVIYRGSDVIPGAVQFVNTLRVTNTPFLFLTNNSQRTRRDMATKLCRMGIEAHENDSGGTRREDLDRFAFQPDLIVQDIGRVDPELTFASIGQTTLSISPPPAPMSERDAYYERMIDLVAPGAGRLWPQPPLPSQKAA